jgi:flagellar hook-associated protein 3 FlgL
MSVGYRVTHRSIGSRALQNLQHNMDRLGRLQGQLSSGRSISRPSDSPTGSVAALRLRSEIRTTEQYARNAQDGLGWLGTIDEALTGSLTAVRRVRDLTLQGMSAGGAAAPGARESIAREVEALRANLLSVANTRYLDRPVFGGTTTSSTAYDAAGVFQGDSNPVLRTVGDDARIQVDLSGNSVFGTGPTSVFTVLSDIANNVMTAPDQLSGDLDRLDAAMATIQSRLADVGARFNRIDQMRQAADDRVLTMKNNLSEVEDIDLPKTIMELQMQEAAYQGALGATARVVQPSLLDFVR